MVWIYEKDIILWRYLNMFYEHNYINIAMWCFLKECAELWSPKDRADFIAGLGVFAPAGEYEPEGSDNTGLGIWQGQFSKLSISNIKFTANGSHKGFAKIGDYLKLKTLWSNPQTAQFAVCGWHIQIKRKIESRYFGFAEQTHNSRELYISPG